jgi:ATP-dependent RNA helicase HrpB
MRASRRSGARPIDNLPIDWFIDPIRDALRRARAVVVSAAPGAGKTTRVPPALVEDDGKVILLQPRRVAARAIAARIADERGWTLGREVGWQIRLDRKFTRDTKLLVVTEGILTARLQSDPLLSEFRTIVVDEFHERSIHADVAIALAKQAWRARNDLRIVVMSATLDTSAVASFLNGCPVIEVPGRLHPIEISYAPAQTVDEAVAELLPATRGDVLCFLPGAAEIGRAIGAIATRVGREVDVLPLHGSLDGADQDRAIRPSTTRRIIVATNIAETSLTVPGVTAVIDSGLHKVARYDADRGIDSLETERITADSAEQRAGRSGRIAPGVVRRLWDARDRLRPHRDPEIHRIDLSSAALDVIAWGGDPRAFEWYEPPRADALDAALALLHRLDILRAGKLTAIGDQAHRLPMHPRLARIVVAGHGSRAVVRACEFLTDRHRLPPRTASTVSDLLAVVDDARVDETEFCRAIFAGYPDRVARRREPRSPNVLLATGTGATIGRDSGVHDAEFLVAVDLSDVARVNVVNVARAFQARDRGPERAAPHTSQRAAPQLPVVRIASAVDRDWLEPTAVETIHRFDAASQSVKAVVVKKYDALVLSEHPTTADPDVAAQLLADAWLARGPADDDRRLMCRLQFAGHALDVAQLIRTAASGARTLGDVRLSNALSPALLREVNRDAPETIVVPSGRHVRLEYGEDGSVSASVKLQELFGLAETPRIGPRREPVLLALLAPNGRPVQLTRDLRSFWDRTYPDVRKELRGRYPKHPWPDDPWTATPTHRAKRRQT